MHYCLRHLLRIINTRSPIRWSHLTHACCASFLLLHTYSAIGAVGVIRTIGAHYLDGARTNHTVTQLSDGSVFVYGPKPLVFNVNSAVRWDAKQHAWGNIADAPECAYTRSAQTATALAHNKILFAGGTCYEPRLLNSDDPLPEPFNKLSLWNDDTQKWESAPALKSARLHHSATLLADGSVIFVGGQGIMSDAKIAGPILASVELLRSATELHPSDVVQLQSLQFPRAKHTTTELADGRVLVVGGISSNGKAIASVEIWSPVTQTWSEGPALTTPRYNHAAELLKDGRLMIAGGINEAGEPTNSVEIWEPTLGAWVHGQPLLLPLRTASAVLLSNGDVLIVGTGFDEYKYTISRSMLWEHTTSEWRGAGVLTPDHIGDIRNTEDYTLLLKKDDRVLIFGNSVILEWTRQTSESGEYLPDSRRVAHATALLRDGRLLLAGGHANGTPLGLTEIYDPAKNTFTLTGSMKQPRLTGMPYQAALSSVVTNDGKVVIAGGWVRAPDKGDEAIPNHPEMWDPETGQWRVIDALYFEAEERVYFGKLFDGRILFFASRELGKEDKPRFRSWLWDPRTNVVVTHHVSATPRANAAIAILQDGRVLVVGGVDKQFVPEFRCPPRSNVSYSNADDEGDGDGCQDNPAHWEEGDISTAEVWDSRSGLSTPVTYPIGWHSNAPQTLLLKRGDVLLVNSIIPNPRQQDRKQSDLIWHAKDGTWSALPPLSADMNWPMTETDDGSLIAWAPENLNPTHVNRLKLGATSWEEIPRFPQKKASVTQLPNGKLLALSSTSPYAAVFDEPSKQWELRISHYIPTDHPALVELQDGRVALLGTSQSTNEIAQIWTPKNNTWRSSGKMQVGRTTGKAQRLPSGKVLNIRYGEVGNYISEIWDPYDDSWKFIGTFIAEKKRKYSPFALGALDDGRVVFIGAAENAFVFDEDSETWTAMQIEWNQNLYTYGLAVRAQKPFARLFDPKTKEWLDASAIGGKYYSIPQNERPSAPAMLWDPIRNHWAYFVKHQTMAWNGFWLPDGCAISGPPFSIYNPSTGKFTEHHELEAAWMRQEAMTVLSDGTVVLAGIEATEEKFFYRKATCDGFEVLSDDSNLMPAINKIVAPPPVTKPVAVETPPTKWSAKFSEWFDNVKWIALAIFAPMAIYFVLRSAMNRLRKKRPNSVFSRPIVPTASGRAFGFLIRVVIYGALAIMVVPPILTYTKIKFANWQEERRAFVVPCRFIGTWSMNARGGTYRFTLKDDGTYLVELSNEGRPAPYRQLGYWEVQGENVVWYQQKRGVEPDVNKILEMTETGFTLLEQNGMHSQFELIDHIKSSTCSP